MALVQEMCFAAFESPWQGGGDASYYQTRGIALGTECRMLFSAPSHAAADRFRGEVSAWLQAFEKRYSRFIETSMISQLNTAAGSHAVDIDDELVSIFKLCDWFHWSSRGLFDPTMLALIRLWEDHTEPLSIPSADAVEVARRQVDWKSVDREALRAFLPREGMALDIGGIGKEYAVDRVIGMMQDAGIQNAMVDFGHDVRVLGRPPEGGGWRIGLEDPRDPGRCWSGALVSDMAIASSGNYARGFDCQGKRYGHILDPRSGYPVDNGTLAVSVIAPTCTEAGILATSAFILGGEAFFEFLRASHQAEGCMVTTNGTLRTPGFVRYELPSSTMHRGGQSL
ncbi:MAG: FAD:protein FMN transferase [Verrucomicrobia bacterium]|jgi:FAD:protein FMN transferase|nr:FAD:protein FMN transferase [Verrucomicrobiota bacterium]